MLSRASRLRSGPTLTATAVCQALWTLTLRVGCRALCQGPRGHLLPLLTSPQRNPSRHVSCSTLSRCLRSLEPRPPLPRCQETAAVWAPAPHTVAGKGPQGRKSEEVTVTCVFLSSPGSQSLMPGTRRLKYSLRAKDV